VDTVYPIDSLPAAAIDDDPFYEIVLSDPLLLDTEFDDLIASAWGQEPPPPHRRWTDDGDDGDDDPSRTRVKDAGAAHRRVNAERTRRQLRTAQRSPPWNR
jgi:hypothetical protein